MNKDKTLHSSEALNNEKENEIKRYRDKKKKYVQRQRELKEKAFRV